MEPKEEFFHYFCRLFFCFDFRVFLNLWFAKPMVCMWAACPRTTEITETTKTTKITQTAANKDLSAGSAELTETMGESGVANHGLRQTTGLEIPGILRCEYISRLILKNCLDLFCHFLVALRPAIAPLHWPLLRWLTESLTHLHLLWAFAHILQE